MKQHYQKMFAYNEWANNMFIDCFSEHTVANAKNFLLMSHWLTAEEVWLSRLQGNVGPQEQLWKEFPLPELQEKAKKLSAAWKAYLEEINAQKLRASVSYKNSKKEFFSSSVEDILNHVINHSTYHRAQVASLLRLEGLEPPVSDYIAYVRLQQSKSEVAEIKVE
ncbi:DinB family protein [Nafulsella turpanensis]|uniref:DinB family protein n=1 Tax=Nafulsella turpanensis TaxID=1265690 RepID=UPI00038280B2|nr:DinB family protein [Nafulsella turpanensis]